MKAKFLNIRIKLVDYSLSKKGYLPMTIIIFKYRDDYGKNMARKSKSNDSILILIGGILAIIGVVLSLFIKEFGWWMWEGRIFLGNGDYFLTAFGGEQGSLMGDDSTLFSEENIQILAGVLALIGGALCLTKKKMFGILGGILIIVGCILFLTYLGDTDLANYLADNDYSIFWGEVSNIFIDGTWQIGYGMITSTIGAILAIIGSTTKK